MLDKKIS